MPADIGVTDQTPTVTRLITVPASNIETTTTYNVPVPLSVLTKAGVYVPIGCNYSVGVGIGFNGKKFIPTDDPDDFIYGPAVLHEYLAGWQVQNGIDVFMRQNSNRFDHRIQVIFHLDRRPTQKTNTTTLIVPR